MGPASAPIPVARVPLFRSEVMGIERLAELAGVLYVESRDPAAVTCTTRPYSFTRKDDAYQVRLHMPFAQKGEIGVFKKDDERARVDEHLRDCIPCTVKVGEAEAAVAAMIDSTQARRSQPRTARFSFSATDMGH